MDNNGIEKRYAVQLYAEQVALLYRNAPQAYISSLVIGAILAFVQGTHIASSVVLGWYAVLVAVTALRTWFARRYFRLRPGPDAARRWNAIYVAGTVLAGSVWGATAFVMIPSTSLAHEVLVAFVLAGMSAGSITVLAFRVESCLAFLLPTLLPLVIRYLTLDTMLHIAMGVMTALFLIGMVVSALNFNRSVRTSLILRFDKRELEAENRRRELAEQALKLEKDRLQAVLNSIGEGVALIDANGCIEYLNPVAERLCGCSSGSAAGHAPSEVFESCDRRLDQRTSTAMEDTLRTASEVSKLTVMANNGGERRIIEELATPLYDHDQKVVGAVSILRDVTEALKKEEELAYAADHDALTSLPNRNLLHNRLHQAVARAQRRDESFALLFLDLDRFKSVNDTLGHAAGDALLVEVARRLTTTVREEDTIARLGGDEFVVLLEGPSQEHDVDAIVDKIRQVLREPYQLGMHSATISVSIGVSLFPHNGRDPDALLRHADITMYGAKRG